MSLKTSPLPQTDAAWRDLAQKTLDAFDEQNDTKSSKAVNVPLPGTSAFASTVDHTLLKLDASEEGVRQCCNEAKQYGFKVSYDSGFVVVRTTRA